MHRYIRYFAERISKGLPFIFIDVGAMGGIPAKWYILLRYIKVLAFEPDKREFRKLVSNDHLTYLNYALSDKSSDLKYYITQACGRSSIYQPNMELLSSFENPQRYQVLHQEVIPASQVKTLDALFKENSFKDADFIKLDTQGSELPILKGGREKVIPYLFGVQTEVEFIPLYKSQPLFSELDAFMSEAGFELIDLRRTYWKRKDYYNYRGRGTLVFGDALYFKNIDIFCRQLSVIKDKEFIKSKIFKAVIVCMIYRIFDYAVRLLNLSCAQGYLSDEEAASAVGMIKKYSRSNILSKVCLERHTFKVLSLILKNLRPPSYLGWVDADDELGNIDGV